MVLLVTNLLPASDGWAAEAKTIARESKGQGAAGATPAACLRVEIDPSSVDDVRTLGGRLAKSLAKRVLPAGHTLVLLTEGNSGKALGNYITSWGALDSDVIVLDEVPPRDAQFVRIGRLREGLVPLWLYAVQ